MAGSYIIKDGAQVIGSSPATFLHSWFSYPLFVGEDGVEYWGTGDYAGPKLPAAPCPQWAMRVRQSYGAAQPTNVWVYPNNPDPEAGEGNTKLMLTLEESLLTVAVAEQVGNSGEIIGGPPPATFSFSPPAPDGGFVYLWLYFDNGNLSVRDDENTTLLTVAWPSLAYLQSGTISGGAPASFFPAQSFPWVITGPIYSLFYNGLPIPSAGRFWTGIVGALETP